MHRFFIYFFTPQIYGNFQFLPNKLTFLTQMLNVLIHLYISSKMVIFVSEN